MRNLLLLCVVGCISSPALAQRGALIEDLFRTIAEAQQQREPQNRPLPPFPSQPPRGPSQVPLQVPSQGPSISVGSRSVADFAENLVNFSRSIDPLVVSLRSASLGNPGITALMPEAYRVAADTRVLINRCNGLNSLDPISANYADLDSRWRQLSFSLRSTEGLSGESTGAVRACDQLAGKMCRQLNLQPQFDRHQLHDLMIIGATHLETLIDDLPLSNLRSNDAQRIAHDVRLMRGRLLKEADRIDVASYEEVVTEFTEFVSRWSPIGEAIYSLNDPHLSRRLDRIRECGDRTYALLWMPPPISTRSLTASAHRLEISCGEVLDQMTIRSLVNLDPREQAAVMERSRRMFRQARELEEATTNRVSRGELSSMLASIDQDWAYLQSVYVKVPRLNPATLSTIESELTSMRDAIGLPSGGSVFDPAALLEVAAAVEGSSEYFLADIRRYERYLQPVAFRQSILAASDDLYQHSKALHANLSGRIDMPTLRRETDHLLDAWQVLSADIEDLEQHGVSGRRAESLKRAHAEMVQPVAQIAAALAGR